MRESMKEFRELTDVSLTKFEQLTFKTAWNAALEKAAKECEELAEDFDQYKEHKYDMKQLGATECAEAIRALKEE